MAYSQNSDHEYLQQPPEVEFELPLLPFAEYPLPRVIDDLDFFDWSDDSDNFDDNQNYILPLTIAFCCKVLLSPLILINLHIGPKSAKLDLVTLHCLAVHFMESFLL